MKIGFVGAGQMATALAVGIVTSGAVRGHDIAFHDVSEEASDHFQSNIKGAVRAASNQDIFDKTPTVFLAVKPQHLNAVIREIDPPTRPVTVVSILAGISLNQLANLFPKPCLPVRVVPNTPCLVGAGISAIATLPQDQNHASLKVVQGLLETVGDVVELPESMLDAVTAVSGSGPAFAALFVQSLIEGGVLVGLPRAIAHRLAVQTVGGTIELMQAQRWDPARVMEAVTSPGGTTIHGLMALEENKFVAGVMSCVRAAAKRATELAGE